MPPTPSSRASSRSSSRSTRRITSAEISPLSRSSTRASRWAVEELVHQPLVGERAVLDPVLVVDLAGSTLKRRRRNSYMAADADDRVFVGPLLDARARRGARAPRRRRAGGRAAPRVPRRSPSSCTPRRADQHRQGQPLADQGDEDDREGDEEDQVAARAAVRRRRWSAAAPAPRRARRRRASPPRRRSTRERQSARGGRAGRAAVERPDHRRRAEDPGEADRDADRAGERRVADRGRRSTMPASLSPSTITGSCRPIRMKRVALSRKTRISQTEKERRRVSGEISSRRPPAEVDAGGDRGEHPGERRSRRPGGRRRSR